MLGNAVSAKSHTKIKIKPFLITVISGPRQSNVSILPVCCFDKMINQPLVDGTTYGQGQASTKVEAKGKAAKKALAALKAKFGSGPDDEHYD